MSTDARLGTATGHSRTAAFGRWVGAQGAAVLAHVDFLGAVLVGIGRLPRERSAPARERFLAALRDAGMGSLPVVGFVGFVAGLVLTLLGQNELKKIGVDVGVPKLVGIVVLRELGGLIVGIALAGRVASSFVAEIAAGNARGEADGLRAAGLDVVDVQAAPRALALLLAAPLLLAYANLLAIVGSAAWATHSLGAAREHAITVLSGLPLKHAIASLVKASAFGFVVALCGCYHGLRCDGTSAALARAVRRAVVASVVAIGVAEVLLIFVFKWIRL